MPTVTLPSGNQVEILDPKQLKNKHRRLIAKKYEQFGGEDGQQSDMAFEVVAYTASLVVTGWSFQELALPAQDMDSLDELSIDDWDALAAGLKPVFDALKGTNFSPSPDPNSPTAPSNA